MGYLRLSADLHNHSCLSPCGDLSMSPGLLAARARERKIDILALTDHNASLNCPPFALACAAKITLFGMGSVPPKKCISWRLQPGALRSRGPYIRFRRSRLDQSWRSGGGGRSELLELTDLPRGSPGLRELPIGCGLGPVIPPMWTGDVLRAKSTRFLPPALMTPSNRFARSASAVTALSPARCRPGTGRLLASIFPVKWWKTWPKP